MLSIKESEKSDMKCAAAVWVHRNVGNTAVCGAMNGGIIGMS